MGVSFLVLKNLKIGIGIDGHSEFNKLHKQYSFCIPKYGCHNLSGRHGLLSLAYLVNMYNPIPSTVILSQPKSHSQSQLC